MHWNEIEKIEKIRLLEETAAARNLPVFVVEKDWWMVQTLRLVFQMEMASYLVFKGGSSLSKAWQLIERFSEDVDLAIDREYFGFSGDISRTQVGKLRDASFEYISGEFLPNLRHNFKEAGFHDVHLELDEYETTDQDPLIVKVNYPNVIERSSYIQPVVLVEIGGRSQKEPFSHRQFASIISEQFSEAPFADSQITVQCVNPERTYLEKLFLLHEEFQRPEEKIRVERLSRHLYDIHRISRSPFAQKAIRDHGLYKSIVAHRELFMKFGGVDYQSHFPPNLNPIPPDNLLPEWEKDYRVMQEQMIYGESLPFNQLIEEVKRIVGEINQTNIE